MYLLEDFTGIVIAAGVVFFLIIMGVIIITRFIVVGNPSEMLVISGKRSEQTKGYRVLIGGRFRLAPIHNASSRRHRGRIGDDSPRRFGRESCSILTICSSEYFPDL